MLNDKLVSLLNQGSSSLVKHEVIRGLHGVLQDNVDALSMEQMSVIVSSLSTVVEKACEGDDTKESLKDDWISHVAKILSLIVTTQLTKHAKIPTNKSDETIRCLCLLLSRDYGDEAVISVSIDCFLELSSDTRTLKPRMARSPGLLASIGKVATNDFTPTIIKNKAIQIIWNLAQERSNLPILARCPKVMEALIVEASTNVEATTPLSQSRHQALETLLKISELVSNRRVLAKQVGLLSCLIRYTRTMTASDTLVGLNKDKLKEHILKIAILL